jgi:hypothetical protein
VSVEGNGDGWLTWCIEEEFNLENLTHIHEVTLSDHANVLRLSNALDLDRFTERYEDHDHPRFPRWIRWDRVSDDHQGIIIAPYIWSRRLHSNTRWYYWWDCSSGCIWDADAIADVTFKGVCPPSYDGRILVPELGS